MRDLKVLQDVSVNTAKRSSLRQVFVGLEHDRSTRRIAFYSRSSMNEDQRCVPFQVRQHISLNNVVYPISFNDHLPRPRSSFVPYPMEDHFHDMAPILAAAN
jgi:hypothetical protein